jgi:F-type H+-transporting ATPase subunit delta
VAERATIARPYARAAFAHAQASKDLAGWSTLLGSAAVAAADPRIARLIGNPHVTGEELVDLLGGFSKKAGGRGRAQLPEGACGESPACAAAADRGAVRELRAEIEGVVDVEVIAAREIAAPQRRKLEAALAKRLGREVRMHTRIDETLLGGAIVRAGDLVIDGSLKGRIERLGSALTN